MESSRSSKDPVEHDRLAALVVQTLGEYGRRVFRRPTTTGTMSNTENIETLRTTIERDLPFNALKEVFRGEK